MKRKLLLILMIITTSLVTISCKEKTIGTVDKVVESVVIDENTEETTNNKNEIKTTLIAKTEKVNNTATINGKIVSYNFTVTNSEDEANSSQILNLNEFKIGTILGEKNENGLNKISWENKSIKGELLSDNAIASKIRILDNNRIYKIDGLGELNEIKAYEKIFAKKSYNSNSSRICSGETLDTYNEPMGLNNILTVIDVENDRYIEINGEALDILKAKNVNFSVIEGDRIYVEIKDMFTENGATTVGYFENNIYTEIFSTTDIINMKTMGDIIYSNGRILFSGFAENKNSIWNYDIENKRLVREIDVDGNTPVSLYPNKQKDKIIIRGMDYVNEKNIYKTSIAEIDKNLEISKLTNVVSNGNETGYYPDFFGWSDDGKEFYLSLLVLNTEKYSDSGRYYEVYKVEN